MVPQAQSFFLWGSGVQCLQQMVLSRLVHRDWCEILVGAPGFESAHWVLDGAGLGSCLCSTLCDLGEVSYPLQVSAYSAEIWQSCHCAVVGGHRALHLIRT